MKIKIHPTYFKIFFFLATAIVFTLYQYPNILFKRPYGIHLWRQSIGLSITQKFKEKNQPVYEPEIQNLLADNHTTGKGAGEFPILYKIASKFSNIEIALKLIHFLLLYTGLYYLFRLFLYLSENQWVVALTSVLLLLTSPVVIYYGLNYLPDAPALGLALASLYFGIIGFKELKIKYLIIFSGLSVFCGLLKVTQLIPFVTIWIMILFNASRFSKNNYIMLNSVFFLSLSLVALWYIYAEWYNDLHNGRYTINAIHPIWSVDWEHIQGVIIRFKEWTNFQLFMFPFSLIFLVSAFIERKKIFTINLLQFLGILVYIILWFTVFNHHDYYMLPFVPLLAMGIFSFVSLLQKNIFTKILMIFILIVNIVYANENIRLRYNIHSHHYLQNILPNDDIKRFNYMHWDYQNKWSDFFDEKKIRKFLNDNNVQKDDRVYVDFDESPTISLYFLQRNGYTAFTHLSDSEIEQLKIPYIIQLKEHEKPYSGYKKFAELNHIVLYGLSNRDF